MALIVPCNVLYNKALSIAHFSIMLCYMNPSSGRLIPWSRDSCNFFGRNMKCRVVDELDHPVIQKQRLVQTVTSVFFVDTSMRWGRW